MLRITLLAFLMVATAIANPFLSAKNSRLIEGIVSCGSAGQLLDITFKEDTGSHECLKVPCDIHVGHTYQLDVDFIPSQNHKAIHVLAIVKFENGDSHELLSTDFPVEVIGGEGYTFNLPWTVTGSLGLGPMTLHIEIGNDDVIELCGEAAGVISQEE